jgi:hypothetical protein
MNEPNYQMQPRYREYIGKPTECRNCGAIIGFHRKVDQRWMPVDLYMKHGNDIIQPNKLSDVPRGTTLCYEAHFGNHNNLTPRHNCKQKIDVEMKIEGEQRIGILKVEEAVTHLVTLRNLIVQRPEIKEKIQEIIDNNYIWADQWQITIISLNQKP